jgi:hypothetical protein
MTAEKRWFDCGFARNTESNRWHVVLRATKGKVLYSNQSFETKEQALVALEKWVKENGAEIEPFLQ